jgi:hypothetical protein
MKKEVTSVLVEGIIRSIIRTTNTKSEKMEYHFFLEK